MPATTSRRFAQASRPGTASRPLLLLSIARALSLDVVLGVICAASLAVWATGVSMPPAWWISLPAATWIVYSADRLFDARRIGRAAHTFRHRFHQEHFRAVATPTTVIASTLLLLVVTGLPLRLLAVGAVIGVAALGHLWLAQSGGAQLLPKELSAAALYTAGIWFAPLMIAEGAGAQAAALVVVHFLTALANLIGFSLFEHRTDALDGQTSIAGSWGLGRTRRALAACTVTGLVVAGGAIFAGPSRPAVACALLIPVLLLPLGMVRHGDYFARDERYRAYGDSIFLILVLPAAVSYAVA